ncbi:MAG: hypothetical protein AB1792_08990 [Candidatus Zixiibacteriota bacterium]
MFHSRVPHVVLASLVLAVAVIMSQPADQVSAEPKGTSSDTLIIIDFADTVGSPGASVPVSVFLQNRTDSIQGFQISVTLSRPDLMAFIADTVIDTCIICLDSACTALDTIYPCTTVVVPSSVQGSIIEDWDYAEARTAGGTNLRLTGLADYDRNHSPLPILPWTNGVLIKVVAQVNCDIPDTVLDRTVVLDVNEIGTYFVDPKGDTISVVQLINGSITVPFTTLGDLDYNGIFNLLDVVKLVNIAFRGYPPACPPGVDDLNCDGYVTLQDVVLLVGHVFRGQPRPTC